MVVRVKPILFVICYSNNLCVQHKLTLFKQFGKVFSVSVQFVVHSVTCLRVSFQLTEQSPGSALRPVNAQLNCSRLELLNLSVELRPFSSAITDCLWPFTPDKRWRQTVFH